VNRANGGENIIRHDCRYRYQYFYNLKHFPRKSYEGVRIVNVAKFLKELEKIFPP